MLVNIISLLILITLILLWTTLMRRAWRSRVTILKWSGLFLAGLLTLLSAALLVLALVGFYKLQQRHNNPVADIQVARTPAQIARGMQLAHICMGCHSPNEQLPLSGANLLARYPLPPIGTLYAPNLTPSGNIKDWTDGEVIRAIREGVHKNGRSLLAMPANDFRTMSDEDVQAVVAYLRSQPAVGGPTPDNQLNLVGALFINFVDFRTAQQPVGRVTAPQPGTPEYGDYLVGVIGCRGCHGKQLQGRLHTGPGGPSGPNLTLVVPQWTEEQFMTFFNTGQLPGGSTVPVETFRDGLKAPIMPWNEVRAATTDEDLKAIYTYIHSLPPVQGP
jgi:mono/diheme cytochrome c family protein